MRTYDVQGFEVLPVSLGDSNIIKVLVPTSFTDAVPVLLMRCLDGSMLEVNPIGDASYTTYSINKKEYFVYAYAVGYYELNLESSRFRENALLKIQGGSSDDVGFFSLGIGTIDSPLEIMKEKFSRN
jgi:hypothetical protein